MMKHAGAFFAMLLAATLTVLLVKGAPSWILYVTVALVYVGVIVTRWRQKQKQKLADEQELLQL